METALDFTIKKSVYNDPTIIMVSWWKTDSYLNNEYIQISDIEIMNAACGSSVSFGSRVRSKSNKHNTYTGWRSYFRSKLIPIHGPVHKYDLNYSYLRSHFSRLTQAVVKKLIYCLSQKFSYASEN